MNFFPLLFVFLVIQNILSFNAEANCASFESHNIEFIKIILLTKKGSISFQRIVKDGAVDNVGNAMLNGA